MVKASRGFSKKKATAAVSPRAAVNPKTAHTNRATRSRSGACKSSTTVGAPAPSSFRSSVPLSSTRTVAFGASQAPSASVQGTNASGTLSASAKSTSTSQAPALFNLGRSRRRIALDFGRPVFKQIASQGQSQQTSLPSLASPFVQQNGPTNHGNVSVKSQHQPFCSIELKGLELADLDNMMSLTAECIYGMNQICDKYGLSKRTARKMNTLKTWLGKLYAHTFYLHKAVAETKDDCTFVATGRSIGIVILGDEWKHLKEDQPRFKHNSVAMRKTVKDYREKLRPFCEYFASWEAEEIKIRGPVTERFPGELERRRDLEGSSVRTSKLFDDAIRELNQAVDYFTKKYPDY